MLIRLLWHPTSYFVPSLLIEPHPRVSAHIQDGGSWQWTRSAMPPGACVGARLRRRISASLPDLGGSRLRGGELLAAPARPWAGCSLSLSAAEVAGSIKMRFLLVLLVAASAVIRSDASANLGGVPSKRLKMQYATGPLLKFQIWWVCAPGPGGAAAPLSASVARPGPGFAAQRAEPPLGPEERRQQPSAARLLRGPSRHCQAARLCSKHNRSLRSALFCLLEWWEWGRRAREGEILKGEDVGTLVSTERRLAASRHGHPGRLRRWAWVGAASVEERPRLSPGSPSPAPFLGVLPGALAAPLGEGYFGSLVQTHEGWAPFLQHRPRLTVEWGSGDSDSWRARRGPGRLILRLQFPKCLCKGARCSSDNGHSRTTLIFLPIPPTAASHELPNPACLSIFLS